MEFTIFKKLAKNIDAFQPSEIDEFEFMTDDELDEYQIELERCSGNLSDWDHTRALFTLRHRLENK